MAEFTNPDTDRNPAYGEITEGEIVVSVNKDAQSFQRGIKDAKEGNPKGYDSEPEETKLSWLKGYVAAAFDGRGDDDLEAAKLNYGAGFDAERFAEMKKAMDEMDTSVTEFADLYDIDIMSDPVGGLAQVYEAFDSLGES